MKKSQIPPKYTDKFGIVHELQENNPSSKTLIDFKNLRKGDKVVITFDDEGKERSLFVKITNIFLDKKLIHFETNDFEYICGFSEINKIIKPNDINVLFWIYSALIPFLCICILNFHVNYSLDYTKYLSPVIPCLYLVIAACNIYLFARSIKSLTEKGTCLWIVILNCILIFCAYMAPLLSGYNPIMPVVWLLYPIIFFALPQQFFLQWYILFKEILHKENPSFILSLFFGIVTGILFFLLLRHL